MGKTSSFTWVCDTWNYNVEHKKSVSRHKKLHSIERVMKYSCLKCFKSFDRKVNFSRHEKTCLTKKKSKNQCNVCQKEFEKPWMLQRHMVIHDPCEKNTFKCDVCGVKILTADAQMHSVICKTTCSTSMRN